MNEFKTVDKSELIELLEKVSMIYIYASSNRYPLLHIMVDKKAMINKLRGREGDYNFLIDDNYFDTIYIEKMISKSIVAG